MPNAADSSVHSDALSSEPVVGGVAEEGEDSAMLQCNERLVMEVDEGGVVFEVIVGLVAWLLFGLDSTLASQEE